MKQREEQDIVLKTLDLLHQLQPAQEFIASLRYQYLERGSLSRKQLQGLLQKALRHHEVPPNWSATIEAIIKKMPVREKAPASLQTPLYQTDADALHMVKFDLEKFTGHKQAQFLLKKIELHEQLTTS